MVLALIVIVETIVGWFVVLATVVCILPVVDVVWSVWFKSLVAVHVELLPGE